MTASKASVSLALLWGHIPRGIIQCRRHISRRDHGEVPFVLSRSVSTGRPAQTLFHSFGNYHMDTSIGPFPVSLVEMLIEESGPVPSHIQAVLHSLSVGFPIVGERDYEKSEKFFNPTVPPPGDEIDTMFQAWLSLDRFLLNPDLLTARLRDYQGRQLRVDDSVLTERSIESGYHFPGETGSCAYIDHPEAVSVRSDRGRPSTVR